MAIDRQFRAKIIPKAEPIAITAFHMSVVWGIVSAPVRELILH